MILIRFLNHECKLFGNCNSLSQLSGYVNFNGCFGFSQAKSVFLGELRFGEAQVTEKNAVKHETNDPMYEIDHIDASLVVFF